jgi:hypothetical protein
MADTALLLTLTLDPKNITLRITKPKMADTTPENITLGFVKPKMTDMTLPTTRGSHR